jgi:small subunit ribosomal protein S4
MKRPAPGKGLKDRSKKKSNYAEQLREKQKLKRIYGMLERQFKIFFYRAERMAGKTGENLIVLLERRLDNVVFRMRFAASRNQARQLVSHGHVAINGKKVTIASYIVKAGDTVAIRPNSQKLQIIKESLKEFTRSGVVPWLEVDPDSIQGKLASYPKRSDVTDINDIHEQLIVELYSR